MAQGAMFTGSYAINGVTLLTEPSSGKWLPKKILGFDGSGHPIYPIVRDFEMDWDFVDMPTINQLINAYGTVQTTGTLIVDLPQFNKASWEFVSYTGATMEEPQFTEYFMGTPSKVVVIFHNIKV